MSIAAFHLSRSDVIRPWQNSISRVCPASELAQSINQVTGRRANQTKYHMDHESANSPKLAAQKRGAKQIQLAVPGVNWVRVLNTYIYPGG